MTNEENYKEEAKRVRAFEEKLFKKIDVNVSKFFTSFQQCDCLLLFSNWLLPYAVLLWV